MDHSPSPQGGRHSNKRRRPGFPNSTPFDRQGWASPHSTWHSAFRPQPGAPLQLSAIHHAASRGGGMASNKPSTPTQEVENQNMEYSHFISLPLGVFPEIVDHLTSFQETVLDLVKQVSKEKAEQKSTNTVEGCGIEGSIFVKPETFHLTVLMLKLWNDERVIAATEALQRCKSNVLAALEGRPIAIRIRGLECMRGSPAKAHVLNACVEETDNENRLVRACQVIVDEFVTAGLVLEADSKQALKLHATLMNTRHRDMNNGRLLKKRIPFDARQILSQFGSIDLGEHFIREIHLSQRFSYGVNGYYTCCGYIKLPSHTS